MIYHAFLSPFLTFKKSSIPWDRVQKVDVENDVLETLRFPKPNQCFFALSVKKSCPLFWQVSIFGCDFQLWKSQLNPLEKLKKSMSKTAFWKHCVSLGQINAFLDFSPLGGPAGSLLAQRILREFSFAKKQGFHVTELKNAMSKTTFSKCLTGVPGHVGFLALSQKSDGFCWKT